jgi:hypothetical protein
MPRPDLLALTPDDLAVLTNRGIVKRAQKDLDESVASAEWSEGPAGNLAVRWSDGFACDLPAGRPLAEARCTCPTGFLCRHLVRTVLAYQRRTGDLAPGPPPRTTEAGWVAPSTDQPPAAAPTAHGPWDPGTISDEALAAHYNRGEMRKARLTLDEGVLVELVRGRKPTALFHREACTLRFLVPGDPRYTHCDCADQPPCRHVPLAVWAFQRLPADREAGVVSTQTTRTPPPTDLLDAVESAVRELAEHGAAGTIAAWRDRVVRLEARCRSAELVWPAEVLGEVAEECRRYAERDARFAPEQLARLVGELLARCDAIRADTGALPLPLVRGSSNDRVQELENIGYTGLGCGARFVRGGVRISTYLQEIESGNVAVFEREFPQPADKPPRPLAELAQSRVAHRVTHTFAALAISRARCAKVRRQASHRLEVVNVQSGLQPLTVSPQDFRWETLRPPVLAEEFAEARARLGALPPACLRPRRVGEDFHVLAVTAAEPPAFDPVTQTVRSVLRDAAGDVAFLEHPYTTAGRQGAEALMARLSADGASLRFVSGEVRGTARGLVVHPVCLVFQGPSGRTALQPWVESFHGTPAGGPLPAEAAAAPQDPVTGYLNRLAHALGELYLLGLMHADPPLVRAWRELARQAEALGSARLAALVGELADELEGRTRELHWEAGPALGAVLRLTVAGRLAQDLAASAAGE